MELESLRLEFHRAYKNKCRRRRNQKMKKKKNPVEEDPWHAQTQSQSSISRSLIYDIVHNLRHRTQSKPNTHTHTHTHTHTKMWMIWRKRLRKRDEIERDLRGYRWFLGLLWQQRLKFHTWVFSSTSDCHNLEIEA